MPYFIYVLKCSDGTLYTGSTNDLKKRLSAHNTSKAAAKYTRGRRPVTIVYSEKLRTKSQALEREWVIKKMTRKEKLRLIYGKVKV